MQMDNHAQRFMHTNSIEAAPVYYRCINPRSNLGPLHLLIAHMQVAGTSMEKCLLDVTPRN
jgi:hypothetical protein